MHLQRCNMCLEGRSDRPADPEASWMQDMTLQSFSLHVVAQLQIAPVQQLWQSDGWQRAGGMHAVLLR